MKKKTINSVICKKFDEWVSSIENESVRKLVIDNTIITGGCITSMLLGEKVNDFDVYFKTKNAAWNVADYYSNLFNKTPDDYQVPITFKVMEVRDGRSYENIIDKDRIKIIVKSAGVAKIGKASDYQYFEGVDNVNEQSELTDEYISEVTNIENISKNYNDLPKYHPVFVSGVAITLKGGVQLVFRFYGEPKDIHETYDFVHTTNYWTSWDRKVVLNQDALESILSKELIFMNSKYPLSAIIRIRKFLKRGWTINAGQILKMAYVMNDLDLSNPDVLEDQLIGVDVAYFDQLISILRSKIEKDKDFKLSASYLGTLIDKIF